MALYFVQRIMESHGSMGVLCNILCYFQILISDKIVMVIFAAVLPSA